MRRKAGKERREGVKAKKALREGRMDVDKEGKEVEGGEGGKEVMGKEEGKKQGERMDIDIDIDIDINTDKIE